MKPDNLDSEEIRKDREMIDWFEDCICKTIIRDPSYNTNMAYEILDDLKVKLNRKINNLFGMRRLIIEELGSESRFFTTPFNTK